MENSSENQKDESRNDVQNGVSGKETALRDDAIPVSDETQGNRASEKIEERGRKNRRRTKKQNP